MKIWKAALAILATVFVSLAFAEDFKTIKGREYKNATVSRVGPDGIVIKFSGGIVTIPFTELPKDVQLRFGYDTDKIEAEQAAASAAEAKRVEEQKAAERERAAKEKNAEADLKRAVEQFQSAEQRATQSYQNATKGILSGQVFVSTSGGESRKLGAVQVGLYARDAIDVLVTGAKNYADVKIQQLSGPAAEAQAALDQAEERVNASVTHGDLGGFFAAQGARDAALKARDAAQPKLDFYYSGAFYFSLLLSPIQTAETDGDGKFAIEVPKPGSFVIAAKAERFITEINWKAITEHYYWLQPVSLEGQQQRVQNLSNNNLTSTTGTSSLIRTKD